MLIVNISCVFESMSVVFMFLWIFCDLSRKFCVSVNVIYVFMNILICQCQLCVWVNVSCVYVFMNILWFVKKVVCFSQCHFMFLWIFCDLSRKLSKKLCDWVDPSLCSYVFVNILWFVKKVVKKVVWLSRSQLVFICFCEYFVICQKSCQESCVIESIPACVHMFLWIFCDLSKKLSRKLCDWVDPSLCSYIFVNILWW